VPLKVLPVPTKPALTNGWSKQAGSGKGIAPRQCDFDVGCDREGVTLVARANERQLECALPDSTRRQRALRQENADTDVEGFLLELALEAA
jgi:hypothetical protein